MDPPEPIATARLDLVPLQVADAGEMAGVLADAALYAFIGGQPPTEAELVDRYRAQVRGRSADGREAWRNWVVRERTSGVAAGFVQATITGGGSRAEVAWLIGVPWQGRGYATEAARGLVAWLVGTGVDTIIAHVHPDHEASAAVAQRAGLVPTDAWIDGERVWRRISPPPGR
jgi:RimJ/RimL family protein N-acetyltransferase